MKWNT